MVAHGQASVRPRCVHMVRYVSQPPSNAPLHSSAGPDHSVELSRTNGDMEIESRLQCLGV